MDNNTIRSYTRNQLSGNYGQAILATIVPGIIFGVVNFIIGLIIGESIILNNVISFITSTLTSFMIITMTLRLAKGYSQAGFEYSLQPANTLGKVFIYTAVIFALTFAIQLPINKLFFDSWFVTEDVIKNILTGDVNQQLRFIWGYIGTIFGVIILVFLITYKLMYTAYILIDRDMEIMDAINKSFQYTKGNFFRIVGMNLFFFGWYILSIFTCGLLLFWVTPYHTISLFNLYLEIKEENGDPSGRYQKPMEAELNNNSPSQETLVEKLEKDDIWAK